MRAVLMMVMTCGLLVGGAGVASAQEDPGPGQVVALLFEHMKAGDADAMQRLMHPEVRLVSTSVRDGVPNVQVMAVDRWLQGIRAATRVLDERIFDTVVHEDAGLAKVWTRYDLFVDGEHSHCGVDDIVLVRTEAGWRIIHLADTRSTEGCRKE